MKVGFHSLGLYSMGWNYDLGKDKVTLSDDI
jgi:hypothetical protein